MRFLPIHVDLNGASVLVVGGGNVAGAKLRTLLRTEAEIVLVAPAVSSEINRWIKNGRVVWKSRAFELADLDGKTLIFAATGDRDLNSHIAEQGRARGLLVNAADQKDACGFISPALIDRSPVIISVSTEGASPGLARAIKADLEARLPSTLGSLAKFLGAARKRITTIIPDLNGRQRFWKRIFSGLDLSALLSLSKEDLEHKIAAAIAGAADHDPGMVSLVGAGPGDPDLLTLQARQRLHGADVIVHDRLVSQGVLDICRREAEFIYVGKTPDGKSISQGEINAILVEKAQAGLNVVRLKGGDPLIFGRADEEIEALEAAGVTYEICPGITSASAAAAAIGVSLTSRGQNQAVSLITGHDVNGFAEHDWKSLAETGARAVVYMGVGAARFIQGRLMLHGAAATLPIAVIENASRPEQKIVSSTLATLKNDLAATGVKGPAILMIGYQARHATALAGLKVGGVR